MYRRSTVVLSLAALACTALLLTAGEARAATQKAKITKLRGRVSHRVGTTGQFVSSKAGALLPAGSRVRTDRGARCWIGFPDGSVVRMAERTDLVVRSATQSNLSQGRIFALIVSGTAATMVGGTATAAVRGTTLEMEVLEDGTTVLTVATGEVDFFNDLGSVTVQASQQSTARPGEAPSRPIVVDPASLQAWEASLQNLMIELELPPQVGTDPDALEQQRQQRQDAADARPDDAAVHAELSAVLLDLRETEEALAAAQRAAELAPDVAEYQGLLGYALLQAGNLSEAEASFARAAEADPENARWLLGRALVAVARGENQAAREALESAGASAPDSPLPRAYLAAVELRLGNLEAAATAASGAAELAPDDHLALSYLAYVRLVQGKLDEAVGSASAAAQAAPVSALAHDALGTACFFSGDFERARLELDRALEINPLSARGHLTLAKLLAAEGELEDALEQGRAAVSLNPASAPAHSTYGLLLMLNNDPEAADEQFQQALTLDANLAEARTGWARVLARRGRFREALNQQKAALALDTDSASAQNNLGGLYAAAGEMPLAIEHLQQAIELQPGWGLPYANLAFVHLELNEHAKALQMGERALELGERSPFVHTVLARIQTRQGRTDRALFELRQAVALDEDYPQAHYQLAQLYLEQDRARDAVREILTALTKDPSAMLETRLYARTETTASLGSHDTIHAEARHSGLAADGRLTYFASGMAEESDGFRAANHDSSERFVEVIAGHQSSPETQLVFYGTWLDTDAGLPGAQTAARAADPDDHRSFTGAEALLAWRQRVSSNVTATLKHSYRDRDFAFRNPESLQGADDTPFRSLDSEETENTSEVRVDADLGDSTRASAGYARRCSDGVRFGAVGTVVPGRALPRFQPFTQSSAPMTESAWAEVETDVSDRLSVLVGERWGRQEDADSVALPKLSVLYRPDERSWLSLTADPIFRSDIAELATTEPLASPQGLGYLDFNNGGAARSYALRYQRHVGPDGALTASAVRQDVRGLLIDVEDPGTAGLPQRVLVGDGERWVLDAAAEKWLSDHVVGRAWVRRQDTDGDFPELQLTGMQWPYAPEWQLGGRLDYIDDSGWRVGIEGLWVDERFHDPENTRTVPSHFVANLRAQYQRSLADSYFLEIYNLTDESYQTFLGFPQPGLSVFAGVEYRH